MDDLDFEGWNNADWQGVFAHQHTDDVYVDFKGHEPTDGLAHGVAVALAVAFCLPGEPLVGLLIEESFDILGGEFFPTGSERLLHAVSVGSAAVAKESPIRPEGGSA